MSLNQMITFGLLTNTVIFFAFVQSANSFISNQQLASDKPQVFREDAEFFKTAYQKLLQETQKIIEEQAASKIKAEDLDSNLNKRLNILEQRVESISVSLASTISEVNHLILGFSRFKKQSTSQVNQLGSSTDDTIKKDENKSVLTWPNGIVPYEIDSGLNKAIFIQAMEFIENKTCIKFVSKTTEHLNWVKFSIRNDEICYSVEIGRNSSSSETLVEIGVKCVDILIVQHLLALTLGYEQTRPGRRQFVQLLQLSFLDIEKLNAIYNCTECNSYRFVQSNKIRALENPKPFESYNPIKSGYDINDQPFYVCRVYYNGELLIGKMLATVRFNGCLIGDGKNNEHWYDKDFDVMTNPVGYNGFKWANFTKFENNVDLTNAIIGGRNVDGIPIYIGRCELKNENYTTLLSGSYYKDSNGVLKVPFGRKEMECDNFQLFSCKQ